MTVRIGIIGLGFGAQVHLPGFQTLPGVEVVGAVATRPSSAFKSWQDLVSSNEIDAVSIATPPFLHREMVCAAIESGKSVLCEKPLALTAADAFEMLQRAEAARIVHMVDFEFREIAAWRQARKLIRDGELGEIRYINIHWTVGSWSDPERPWSWRADKTAGGGTLSALGVHTFDYIEWLFGPIAKLCAQLSTRIPTRPAQDGQRMPVTSEDHCNLMIELANGTPVSVMISAVAARGRGHWIEVSGEKSLMLLGSKNLRDYGKGFRVWLGDRKSTRFRSLTRPGGDDVSDGRIAPFVGIARRFVEAIATGQRAFEPSFREGYRAQLAMDAAYESSLTGRWANV